MREEKGFTLIELLAVIVILGVIMMIAIPSVTEYITSSRKSSMVSDAKMFVSSARERASLHNELPTSPGSTNKFSVCDAELESGGKTSPFGAEWDCENSYVEISYDGSSYDYYVKLLDKDGNYLPIKNNDELSPDQVVKVNPADLLPLDETYKEVIPTGNIYKISNPSELAWISQQVENGNNFLGKTIELQNDINLGGVFDSDGNQLSESKEFPPIGTSAAHFSGDFDGKNNTISNLYVNKNQNLIGLFGTIDDSKISNFTLSNSYIKGDGAVGIIGNVYKKINVDKVNSYNNHIIAIQGWVGGIIGQIRSDVTDANIANCKNNSTITGGQNVGGIVGFMASSGNVSNNINNGMIFGDKYQTGGIIGIVTSTAVDINISNNINNKNVTVNSYYVGGIIGSNSGSGNTTNNINNGTIKGEEKWIGGIAGITGGDVTKPKIYSDNINNGKVTTTKGAFRVAGIVGMYHFGASPLSKYIANALNTGSVSGIDAGGLVGSNVGISNSINIGGISGTNVQVIIAKNDGVTLNNNFYLSGVNSTSGTSVSQSELTSSFYKNVLGTTYWNFDSALPKLKKVTLSGTTGSYVFTPTNDLLN